MNIRSIKSLLAIGAIAALMLVTLRIPTGYGPWPWCVHWILAWGIFWYGMRDHSRPRTTDKPEASGDSEQDREG